MGARTIRLTLTQLIVVKIKTRPMRQQIGKYLGNTIYRRTPNIRTTRMITTRLFLTLPYRKNAGKTINVRPTLKDGMRRNPIITTRTNKQRQRTTLPTNQGSRRATRNSRNRNRGTTIATPIPYTTIKRTILRGMNKLVIVPRIRNGMVVSTLYLFHQINSPFNRLHNRHPRVKYRRSVQNLLLHVGNQLFQYERGIRQIDVSYHYLMAMLRPRTTIFNRIDLPTSNTLKNIYVNSTTQLLDGILRLSLTLNRTFHQSKRPNTSIRTLPTLYLYLNRDNNGNLVQRSRTNLRHSTNANLPFPLRLIVSTTTTLPNRHNQNKQIRLANNGININNSRHLNGTIGMILLPFRRPPIRPTLVRRLTRLLRHRVPRGTLRPNRNLYLIPTMFLQRATRSLLLRRRNVPRHIRTIKREINKLLMLQRFRPLATKTILNLHPVLNRVFVSPYRNFFMVTHNLRPLRVVKRASIRVRGYFIRVFRPISSFLSNTLLFPRDDNFRRPILNVYSNTSTTSIEYVIRRPMGVLSIVNLRNDFRLQSLPPMSRLFRRHIIRAIPIMNNKMIQHSLVQGVPNVMFKTMHTSVLGSVMSKLSVNRVISKVTRRRNNELKRVMVLVPRQFHTRRAHRITTRKVSRSNMLLQLSTGLYDIFLGMLRNPTSILRQDIVKDVHPSTVPRGGNNVTRLVRLPNHANPLLRLNTLVNATTDRSRHGLNVFNLNQRVRRTNIIFNTIHHLFHVHMRQINSLGTVIMILGSRVRPLNATFNRVLINMTLRDNRLPRNLAQQTILVLQMNMRTKILSTQIITRFLRNNLNHSIKLSLFRCNANKRNRRYRRARRRHGSSFYLFRIPFLSPNATLVTFSHARSCGVELREQRQLFFILLCRAHQCYRGGSIHGVRTL